jgi:hypothetical protein
MVKRLVLTTAAFFVVWSVWDVIVHGLLLQSDYGATADGGDENGAYVSGDRHLSGGFCGPVWFSGRGEIAGVWGR